LQRARFALLFELMLNRMSARLFEGPTGAALVVSALFAVTVACGLGACAANGAADASGSGGTGSGGTSGGGMGGMAGLSFTLGLGAFSPVDGTPIDPLHLKPGDVATIAVTTSPAAAHTVRFAFLGSPLDAVLSDTSLDTDPDLGTTAVTLTAPSTPTSFSVRASSPGAPAVTLDLAVEETNMAALSIKPSYPGERVLSGYVASVTPGIACTDLGAGSPPDDGPILAPSSDMWPIALEVPTGVKLAVMLRAQRFAWGCTTLNGASEGMPNDVEVVIANVPMKLESSNLGFELDLDAFDEFDQALAGPTTEVTDALLGNASDDVVALLDAMRADLSDATAFDTARKGQNWDEELRAALGSNAATVLRDPLSRWIQAGLAGLPTSGGLTGSLAGSMSGAPSVTLGKVFGIAAQTATFKPSGAASWEAGADDRVVMGMSVALTPTTFLLAEALGPASAEVADATSLAVALGESLPCSTVAATLVAAGVAKNQSFTACNAACTKQICVDAVQTLTDAAFDADLTTWTLDVALTASGTVGSDAELASFSGRWLGRLMTADGASSLTGVATSAPAK
jgi:hypothetical protein